jgi:fatty acid desaturase
VDALLWFQLLGLVVVVVVLLQLVLLFFFFFPHSGHHSSEKKTWILEICQNLETKCGFYYFLPT